MKTFYISLALCANILSLSNSLLSAQCIKPDSALEAQIDQQLKTLSQTDKVELMCSAAIFPQVTNGAMLTNLPNLQGQAASFNRQIPKRIGQIMATEGRNRFSPQEFGEDVWLNQQMAVEVTKGMQGSNLNHIDNLHQAACLMDYPGMAEIHSKEELLDPYLEPYKACCKAGALSISIVGGACNGQPFLSSHQLLSEWIKQGLIWDGLLSANSSHIENLWRKYHVANNTKDAIALAINAGIDLAIPTETTSYKACLEELVNEGTISKDRLDDAVRRILRYSIRTQGAIHTQDVKPLSAADSTKLKQDAVRMSEECMVLLKNQGDLLPLNPAQKILLLSSDHRLVDAMSQQFENMDTFASTNFKDFKKAASHADVVVIQANDNISESLLSKICSFSKPVVLLLEDKTTCINQDLTTKCQSLVHIFTTGEFGYKALANLLSGKANFSARMPYTLHLPKKGKSDIDITYPFGYGLSYSQVSYANIRIKQMANSIKPGIIPSEIKGTEKDKIIVCIDVTNHSDREVREPILMFVSNPSQTNRPRLRSFKKLGLAPHETKTVELTLRVSDLACINQELKWMVETGEYQITVANQTIKFGK